MIGFVIAIISIYRYVFGDFCLTMDQGVLLATAVGLEIVAEMFVFFVIQDILKILKNKKCERK